MSHFVVVVLVDPAVGTRYEGHVNGRSIQEVIASASTALETIVRNDTAIYEKVEELLEPYDENLEVEPHRIYLDEAELEGAKNSGDESDTLWEKIREYFGAEFASQDEAGYFYVTTRNQKAEWDWWRVGGRWDGWLTGSEDESEDGGFNFNPIHEGLKRNSVIVREMKEIKIPFAIIDPDGEWHQRASMGWWGATSNEKEPDEWEEEVKSLYAQYPDYLAVAVDCHI